MAVIAAYHTQPQIPLAYLSSDLHSVLLFVAEATDKDSNVSGIGSLLENDCNNILK